MSKHTATTNAGTSHIRLLILTFFTFTLSVSFAQTNLSSEDKLIELLGQSKFDQLQEINPSYLRFLDARCSQGYMILDMPKEKTVGFEMLKKIAKLTGNGTDIEGITPEQFIADSETEEFNFLMYQFEFDRSEITYYILGKTGKVLMIQPVERINDIVNAGNND